MEFRGDQQRANALMGGIWLIGFGVLFATRWWWPGIMFLIGITAIIQCWLRGHPFYAMHAGFWAIFIGFWAVFRFSMAFFFVALGAYVILSALLGPTTMRKRYVDNTLE
jgi:hypothetical protein